MADIKVGDRVELLELRYYYDEEIMDVGTFGTVVGGLDEDNDYNVDWDCKDGKTQRRYAHKDTIKGAGLRFNEVFQQVPTLDELTTGVKVRIKDVSAHVGPYVVGDEGTIPDPGFPAFGGKVWVNIPGKIEEGHGWAMKPESLEILKPAETAPEAVEVPVLPLTHGEVINVALGRLRGAADVIDQAFGTVTKEDQELAAGLRVVVAALIINPRGEQALRKLIGE